MKKLKYILKKNSGRDVTGQVSTRHQGGRHKRFYRVIDFKRSKTGMQAVVSGIEYDPNRSADVALLFYPDGEKSYIIAPNNLKVGDKVMSGENADIKVGNALPLEKIPLGAPIHNIELTPGNGGILVRSAGNQAFIMSKEEKYVVVKMPSGEIRKILGRAYATIGQVSGVEWKDRVIGSAGRKRRMGIRPHVRGVAMAPSSHPHGGGEGRSGIGMPSPKTYAGRKAVGNTRNKKKYSKKYIVKRRNSK